jgi:hypothetical protein
MVCEKALTRGNDVPYGAVAGSLPDSVSPLLRRVPFVPEVLAVEGVLGVEAQLMGMDARNGDGLRAVGCDAPNVLEVGVEDVSGRVFDDPDARMGGRWRTGNRHEQHKEHATDH